MFVSFGSCITFHRNNHPGGTNMPAMTFHLGYEIYFLLSGKKRYIIANEPIDFEAPAVLFIRPAVLHMALSPDDNPHSMAVIGFTTELVERYSELLGNTILATSNAALLFKPEARLAVEFADDVSRIIADDSQLGRAALSARVLETIWELSRITPFLTIKSNLNISNEKIIAGVLSYIEQNLGTELHIEEAAVKFGYAPDELTRLLRRYTGCGWRDHVCLLRCERALRMLVDEKSTFSITEIAEKCGFSSANYFGDFIIHRIKISPSEYRKRYRGYVRDDEQLPLFRYRI